MKVQNRVRLRTSICVLVLDNVEEDTENRHDIMPSQRYGTVGDAAAARCRSDVSRDCR